MPQECLLAIDYGTQSVRALLFNLQGDLVESVRLAVEPYVSPQHGWAEQAPEYFWEMLSQACRALWAKAGAWRAALRGVALTTQRGTVINVDRAGQPLRPAILWLDQRQTQGVKPVGGWWGLLFRLIGMRKTLAYLQAEAEANWIAKHQPEIWRRTHKYLLLSGYLSYKLTGQFVDSVGCQVGYLPFDYRAQRWASRRSWHWQALPLTPEMLPDLVEVGGVLGAITAEAAEATGIPAGMPLIAAAADKACEMLGCGVLMPQVGHISYGTTATFNTLQRRYIEAIPMIPPYPAAVPKAYALETQISRGYWMVDWFKREFGAPELRLAAERGVPAESLLDALAAQVPPGALGLILQPYWSPGIKVPGIEAKGAVIGFGGAHTRAHLYRAILEGIAYALREAAQRTERRTGLKLREVRVSGGGSQSEQAMQITADVFGLPAVRPHLYEASGLGAALVAAVGLGLHSDYQAAVQAMTRLGRAYEPKAENHSLYNALFERVYKRLYRGVRPLYAEISRITGYPSPLG
ncbi:MAG: carbohydrate kinase [Candidatus Thermofonsia Clade 1 bacterium]|uniref:Carbohydrate kinase n=1 Tax=Candidatus Thermofonsia Clade 1 bacterium TaxID=2364210 RepID=A0A2M8PIL5_9CHLR|nr:MAG: carbohydrate kinase [Candidatus Thermofonsia Clade 1 bacterium]RMF52957.1 MAG: carbohydrate kinase [Chloroflexota bacterium]